MATELNIKLPSDGIENAWFSEFQLVNRAYFDDRKRSQNVFQAKFQI